MQHRTHAAFGAWSLGSARRPAAWGDSHRSIELVGSNTTSPPIEQVDVAASGVFQAGHQLVEAARAWLQQPHRRQTLSEQAIMDATRTVDVAMDHFRELDLLAGEVARDAAAAGELDPLRVEQVSLMAATLEAYATRLRSLLDPETVHLPEAEQRLQAALEASSHGGGLPALVAAL